MEANLEEEWIPQSASQQTIAAANSELLRYLQAVAARPVLHAVMRDASLEDLELVLKREYEPHPVCATAEAKSSKESKAHSELSCDFDGSVDAALHSDGTTALHHACRHGRASVAIALISAGASVDLIDRAHGGTPIRLAHVYLSKRASDRNSGPPDRDKQTSSVAASSGSNGGSCCKSLGGTHGALDPGGAHPCRSVRVEGGQGASRASLNHSGRIRAATFEDANSRRASSAFDDARVLLRYVASSVVKRLSMQMLQSLRWS